MTGLGRASVFLPILASDYAILMLINGQLTDFCVTARFSAIATPGAALFARRGRQGKRPIHQGRSWFH